MAFELLVLTYNIRCAAGPDGQKEWRAVFLPEIAADIRAVDPDIAGIQEIDRFSKVRSFNRDLPAELGSLTSRNCFFAPARDYDGGKYGICALFRDTPVRTGFVALPGEGEARVLLMAEFENYVFFNTHFALDEASRDASVPIIASELAKIPAGKPAILVGDFNMTPDSRAFRELQKDWTCVTKDEPTAPTPVPDCRIDFIFVSKGAAFEVVETRRVDEAKTSDHFPIAARLRFK